MHCKCPHPYKTRVADVRTSRPTSFGRIEIVRYCDCCFCGPSSEVMLVYYHETDTALNHPGASDVVAPAHLMHQPFNRLDNLGLK